MALKIDFLTSEIFVKIITKGLGVFRTLFLLFFFSVSSVLDNFYFAKSIIGIVILLNILVEITYSNQLSKFKDNNNFIKRFALLLNKLAVGSGFFLILFFLVFSKNIEITYHIIILTFWGILNINANYYLLLFRYQTKNTRVLFYYFLISIFDIVLLFILIKGLKLSNHFLSISLSIFFSEFFVFLILFIRFIWKTFKEGKTELLRVELEKEKLYKVFFILVIISLIDISDKFFLSYIGEGKITYYTYGLYAPLMIRQALDIRTNFFVQINNATKTQEIKTIFLKTLKKIVPFFLVGVLFLILGIHFFEDIIIDKFHIKEISVFKNIVYLGILITPFYMIWDLFYRFYYRSNKINLLVRIVIFGLLINILLNYFLGFTMSLGIYGILISTIGVFIFYNILSFNFFFNKRHE